MIIINESFSPWQDYTTRYHHIRPTYREKHLYENTNKSNDKSLFLNLLSRPPEPDFIEASRLIAGLLVGKLAFDEVWCQGAAKFPSNYLLARAPQLFTFRTQHVDQTTSYNQREVNVSEELWSLCWLSSCLVLSSNFGIHFLNANNGWAWWMRWSE